MVNRHHLDKEMLQRLWNEGYATPDIAERLGSTVRSVHATVRLMRDAGVPLTRRRNQKSSTKETHHVE
jgi:hypothetical protein